MTDKGISLTLAPCYVTRSEWYFNQHIHKMGLRGPKHHFWQPVLIKKCQKAQILCVPLFLLPENIYHNFSEFTRNCAFVPI